ncbi:MAG: phosphatase PAP2 family protein [Promethearchaeota archaeon]
MEKEHDKKEHLDFLERIKVWDVKYFKKINDCNSTIVSFLKYYTHLGSFYFWEFVLILVMLASWLLKNPCGWMFAKYLAANYIATIILIAVKYKIKRTRPCHKLNHVKVRTHQHFYKGPSFPSIHVQFFLSNALVIAQVISIQNLDWLAPTIIFSLILSALMALSRIYVGVHYPTDVIFGGLAGLANFLLTIFVMYPILINIFPYK